MVDDRAALLDTVTVDEAVALVQKFLGAGVVGFHGLYAEHQMDYRASYHQVCLLSAEWSNTDFDDARVKQLRDLINTLGTTPSVDPGVYAVNTTFHGKDTAFQNHAPE